MSMGALSWLTGVGVPTLAGIGLLAAAAFAWFRLPVLGKYAGLALACVGVAMIANARGFADARALCNEAAVRAELAQVRADLAHAQAAAKQAREIGDRLAAAEARNMELVNDIQNRPTPDGCRLSPDDLRRLLGIR
jgi:hypothetical protein